MSAKCCVQNCQSLEKSRLGVQENSIIIWKRVIGTSMSAKSKNLNNATTNGTQKWTLNITLLVQNSPLSPSSATCQLKNEEVQDIMAKWRTIRDNYARNLKKNGENSKSGSGAKKIRLYIYADQLSFLGKTKELRNTESNFDHVTAAEEEIYSIDQNEQVRDDDGSPSPTSSATEKAKTKIKKPDVERALIDFMESHKVPKKPLENDDLAFFYSLLLSVQSLNMEQKFMFRMKTMQLLYSLRNNETMNQSMQSPSTVSVPTQNMLYRPAHIVCDRDNIICNGHLHHPSDHIILSFQLKSNVNTNKTNFQINALPAITRAVFEGGKCPLLPGAASSLAY
ncbi:hypothetical protein QTP88_003605 [Uroleucon formosanum]